MKAAVSAAADESGLVAVVTDTGTRTAAADAVFVYFLSFFCSHTASCARMGERGKVDTESVADSDDQALRLRR